MLVGDRQCLMLVAAIMSCTTVVGRLVDSDPNRGCAGHAMCAGWNAWSGGDTTSWCTYARLMMVRVATGSLGQCRAGSITKLNRDWTRRRGAIGGEAWDGYGKRDMHVWPSAARLRAVRGQSWVQKFAVGCSAHRPTHVELQKAEAWCGSLGGAGCG